MLFLTKKRHENRVKNEVQKTIQAMSPKQIQAINEGERLDVLTSGVTGISYNSTGDAFVDKNNYTTYSKQIQTINRMYNSETDYGAEMLSSVIDTRVSFIAGGGVSVTGKKQKTIDFVVDFLGKNNLLKGTGLLDLVKIGEMEGKCLAKLKRGNLNGEDYIKAVAIDWYNNPYDIEMRDKEVTKITLSTGGERDIAKAENMGAKIVDINKAQYFKLGGSPDRVNETPPKIAKILTDIVNLSRAKYDMRGNNHLYGKPQWTALTETDVEARSLNAQIDGRDMSRSTSFAGTAKNVFYLEPSGKAQEVLDREILLLARFVSINTGIPVHWLAWPDLMSNRATAETMLETINSATIQDRMIYEEGLTQLVRKAMKMSVNIGIEGAVYDPYGFELKLDLISYAMLKQISETWIPLAEGGYISHQTAMSQIPGVDPAKEKKLIDKENKEDVPSIMEPRELDNEQVDEEGRQTVE